jgi:2'-5' RNA ligase
MLSPMNCSRYSYLVKAECTSACNRRIAAVLALLPNEVKDCFASFRSNFHCTLLFAVSWKANLETTMPAKPTPRIETYSEKVAHTALRSQNMNGTALAFLLDVPEGQSLRKRNAELVQESNAVEEHPKYTPHVTVGYLKRNPSERPLPESAILTALDSAFEGFEFIFDRENDKLFAHYN